MKSFIFYRGPSQLDGAPIVGIAVLRSKNGKTGDMVQTYILRADQSPLEALASGADASVCGACQHRPRRERRRDRRGRFARSAIIRTCYVDVAKSVSSVYRAFMRGSYPQLEPVDGAPILADRMVRLGAYGDPAAIPAHVWIALLADAAGHTGYTHQWRSPLAADFASIVMASADGPTDRDEARAAGWRTFTVRTADQPLAAREIVCPASPEGGDRLQCIDCGACDGADRPGKVSIAIVVHGAMARHFRAAA
ncbi:MAG: hypothetical protein EBZ50_07275 [Alphaproteobacteria bacterium]|nr:hypothetical protein [Alphaproteobacteria bacterium]